MFNLFRENPTDLTKEPDFSLAKKAFFLHDAMYNESKKPFNVSNPDHVLMLDGCTKEFNEKLKSLKYADNQVAIGFGIGAAAFIISFFFPVSLIMWGGLIYGTAYLAARQHLFTEYTQSLENMMNAVHWSLGTVNKHPSVKDSTVVLNLLKALVPVTTRQQLFPVIDDKVEIEVVIAAESRAEEPTFADIKLNDEQKRLYYVLYGFDQGNLVDVLPGIGYALMNIGRAALDGFNYAKNTLLTANQVEIEEQRSLHRQNIC